MTYSNLEMEYKVMRDKYYQEKLKVEFFKKLLHQSVTSKKSLVQDIKNLEKENKYLKDHCDIFLKENNMLIDEVLVLKEENKGLEK